MLPMDNLAVLVPASFLLLALLWVIVNYNRFVRLRHHIRESWSDIDVELKRRYELIPNLVSTVKGFAKHERELFERVTQLRNQAMANRGSASSQASDESALLIGLKSVFALAENYPQLRSDRHFLELQQQLALTEDRIAAARRFFNANVRDMNQMREMFPTSILAAMFNFEKPSYFELDSDAERVVPRVSV